MDRTIGSFVVSIYIKKNFHLFNFSVFFVFNFSIYKLVFFADFSSDFLLDLAKLAKV